MVEEMHCVLVFLQWESEWWKKKEHVQTFSMTSEKLEGAVAYAEHQATLWISMHNYFTHLWCYTHYYVKFGTSEILEVIVEMEVKE